MDESIPAVANPAPGTGTAAPPDFEINLPSGGGLPFHLPAAIKSLSAGGAILEVHYPPEGLDLRELQARGGVIHLPQAADGPEMAIRGTVLWTRPQVGDHPYFLLGLELENPTPEVRQAIESRLPIGAKDIKELWDHWDRFQEKPAAPASSSQQGVYVVGLGVVLGGVVLQMWGPENLQGLGFILVLYGCATLAVKSVWSLWRQRPQAKSRERVALD